MLMQWERNNCDCTAETRHEIKQKIISIQFTM